MASNSAEKDLNEVALHTEEATDDVEVAKNGLPRPEPEQSIWQEIKNNPRVIAYAALANVGSLAFGYDILVTGAVTAVPAFG